MSLSSDGGTVMTMPVQPAYQDGNGGFGGWGGDWASWIILFLIFGMFGWGGFGGGWGGNSGSGLGSPSGQGWATRADINEGFALNNLQSGINSIQQGICDSTYALNNAITNGFHGVDTALCNLGSTVQGGFNATQVAMMQGQNALQAQLAQCCCDQRAATQDLKYTIATEDCATRNLMQSTTRDIIDNANANSRAILQALNDNYVRQLENENQSLKLAASQSNQNAVLMAAMDANKAEILRRTGAECPTPAYVVQPPQPVTFPNFGCGCGSCSGGCGC